MKFPTHSLLLISPISINTAHLLVTSVSFPIFISCLVSSFPKNLNPCSTLLPSSWAAGFFSSKAFHTISIDCYRVRMLEGFPELRSCEGSMKHNWMRIILSAELVLFSHQKYSFCLYFIALGSVYRVSSLNFCQFVDLDELETEENSWFFIWGWLLGHCYCLGRPWMLNFKNFGKVSDFGCCFWLNCP